MGNAMIGKQDGCIACFMLYPLPAEHYFYKPEPAAWHNRWCFKMPGHVRETVQPRYHSCKPLFQGPHLTTAIALNSRPYRC